MKLTAKAVEAAKSKEKPYKMFDGGKIFKSSKTSIKRQLISLVFSNLQLSAGNLQYFLREPFKTFENLGGYKKWLCLQSSDNLSQHYNHCYWLFYRVVLEKLPVFTKKINLKPQYLRLQQLFQEK